MQYRVGFQFYISIKRLDCSGAVVVKTQQYQKCSVLGYHFDKSIIVVYTGYSKLKFCSCFAHSQKLTVENIYTCGLQIKCQSQIKYFFKYSMICIQQNNSKVSYV